MVWERSPQGHERNVTSAYNYSRWRERAQSLESIGAMAQVPMNVSGLGPAHQVDGLAVTAGFFDALGVRPLLGRAIRPADERIRPPRVVVLSYGFWQQHYGGARDVIGKSIDVNGGPREIVGVMPAGFAFPAARMGQLYMPLVIDPAAPPGGRNLITVARMKRGLTLEAARSDMRARGGAAHPGADAQPAARLERLGVPAARRDCRAGTSNPLGDSWIRDVSAAARLRQRRQPGAHPCGEAHARTRVAHEPGSRPVAAGPAAGDRKRAGDARRGRGRPRAGPRRDAGHSIAVSFHFPASPRDRA